MRIYRYDTDTVLITGLDMNKNLKLVDKVYNDFKNIENPTKKDVDETSAKIHWLISQECPYVKGNDSIANVLVRALYHSNKIPQMPVKKGCSLDFEAFYRSLKDYIKNFCSFFVDE